MKSHIVKLLIALCLSIGLVSCGGGSSGTGVPDGFVGKVLTGKIVDETNAPVENATVTVVETGDSASTDVNGDFEIAVDEDIPVSLKVNVDNVESTVAVNDEANGETRVDVQVSVNRRTGVVNIKNLEVLAKIVGNCDFAFENTPIIRQGNKLKDGTVCPVQVTVRSSHKGLSGIPFRIERSRCDKEKWILIKEEITGLSGIGELNFTFKDNDEFCQYRIIAPYNVKGLRNTIHPVHTFRKQNFDKSQKSAKETLVAEGGK